MCELRRHTDTHHALFVAIAMWGRNQCTHCLSSPERQAEGYGFLMDEQVMLGWGPVFDDGSTFCTMCGERFTATLHYRVWFASGRFVDDSCAYLSPALMRCQLEAVVNRVSQDSGPGVLCVYDMLHLAPHLYWNLAWYNTRMARPLLPLPYSVECTFASAPCLGGGAMLPEVPCQL